MKVEYEAIIREVLFRLGQLEKVMVISSLDYSEALLTNLEKTCYVETVETVEEILENHRPDESEKPTIYMPHLSCCEMMQVAMGVGGSQVGDILCVLLLRGISVRVRQEDVEFLGLELGTSPLYKNHLRAYNTLTQSGLVIENHPEKKVASEMSDSPVVVHHKKLLDEKELINYEKNGQYRVSISNKVIVTPLAQDYLRQNQITLLRE